MKTISEMRDCGIDYDYAETIRQGDAYEWDDEEYDFEPYYDIEMGFDPYVGCYTDDC